MPKEGAGRWCRRGSGPLDDLPWDPATCSAGAPGEADQRLYAATRRNFLAQCSGFAARQDWAFLGGAGVDPAQTITLAVQRHPVDRTVSSYFHAVQQKAPGIQAYRPANASDFSGLRRFVEDDPHRLSNVATQAGPGGGARKVLAVAKRNLEKACLIVLTEYLDESLIRLARTAGWPEDLLLAAARKQEEQSRATGGTRVNATPRPQVPKEIRQLIASYNQLDVQLYEHAVRLFLHQDY
ncbi:hypothetical protein ABPG75_004659 [Micractinium tetrahymenae]